MQTKGKSCQEEALCRLEYGDRTEKEMVRRLTQKGYDEREIAETMAFLVELQFIDDRRYSMKFVETAMEKGRGPQRIRYELKEKGVSSALIEEAMEALYDRDAEKEMALQAAEKALRTMGIEAPAERLSERDKAKIARRLASAGFSASATYGAISRLK